MEQDLTGMHVQHNKNVSEMSDEEKSFYYFKIHDTDNNNNLDGLEMIKAALHRHGSDNEQADEDELVHITSQYFEAFLYFLSCFKIFLDVVDEFLLFADLNKNGFLNYAEYKMAMTASSNEEKEESLLTSSGSENNEI